MMSHWKIGLVEHKSFNLKTEIVGRSEVLSITECGRGFTNKFFFKHKSLQWLLENLKLAARLPAVDKLARTHDKGDKVLVVQRRENTWGRFVEVVAHPRSGRGR